jgi:hypothetical protein
MTSGAFANGVVVDSTVGVCEQLKGGIRCKEETCLGIRYGYGF